MIRETESAFCLAQPARAIRARHPVARAVCPLPAARAAVIGPSAICFCRGMAAVRGISGPPWRSGGSRPGRRLPSAHGMRRS